MSGFFEVQSALADTNCPLLLSAGDYTDKLIYTDVNRVKNFLAGNPAVEPGLSLDDEHAVEIRFVVKCKSADQQQDLLSKLKLLPDIGKE